MRGGVCVIGLTGRSGSGKSTVADWLRQAGFAVLDADKIAAAVTSQPDCLRALAAAFGADIIGEDGQLRRRLLAERAFAEQSGQQTLTAITHPYVVKALLQAIDGQAAAGARLVFVDGAVIVDAPFAPYCDKLLVVDAPEQAAIERLCARDGLTPAAAARRLAAQTPRQRLLQVADAVIVNDGDLAALRRRTQNALQELKICR